MCGNRSRRSHSTTIDVQCTTIKASSFLRHGRNTEMEAIALRQFIKRPDGPYVKSWIRHTFCES
jgi:hypothetical protein